MIQLNILNQKVQCNTWDIGDIYKDVEFHTYLYVLKVYIDLEIYTYLFNLKLYVDL